MVPESFPYIEAGKNFTLACILNNIDDYDSSDITWTFKPYGKTDTENVTSLATVADSRTSLLFITEQNMNTSNYNRGRFSCVLPDGVFVDRQTILVGELPAPPTDLECFWENNDNSLVICSWRPGNQPQITTTHILSYRQFPRYNWENTEAISQCECQTDDHCCDENILQREINGLIIGLSVYIKVTVVNALGTTSYTVKVPVDEKTSEYKINY